MLHPIIALDQVIDEYRNYLRTEFRAKDSILNEALEQALDQSYFLAQEPFYQAHRPFKNGKKWRDLSLDPKLARVMEERAQKHGSTTYEYAFLHQSDAIEALRKPDPGPVVVTTGTGSGKTEAFLLPVIQNAIDDAVRYKQPGLTAILVYPMNALANDQLIRIEEYLGTSGFGGTVSVAKYDRGTTQSERESLRKRPPHILLTNYMMLEYLLVRPADRENIFANHRCRFLVLDEVHTYRGTLGSNIALLVRRLKAHLDHARQDWHSSNVSEEERPSRYPQLVPIGTSATIKSVSEVGRTRDEVICLRDEAVQEFFGMLTGVEKDSIRVIGEEVQELEIPEEAIYPASSKIPDQPDVADTEAVHRALCELAEVPSDTPLQEAIKQCRLLWDLNNWLMRTPMSINQIVQRLKRDVPERENLADEQLRAEVEAALEIGAALPDGLPGVLRLRAHRFIRGGWQFHRCINPDCGRLFPMGEEECEACGSTTAPLYLCRNCGADYLRFVGEPEEENLRASAVASEGPEKMLYAHKRFESFIDDEGDDEVEEEQTQTPTQRRRRAPLRIKKMPVLRGSFDYQTLSFSKDESDYPLQVTLSPARNRCLCCGGTAGSRNVLTPVALGTSAAVKVVGEGLIEALAVANQDREEHDGKERLLIFSDSRQDAAHQARFIIFSSRYDRMRRRLARLLEQEGPLTIQRAVELLGDAAVQTHDNPFVPEEENPWITDENRQRIQAWEEAPLLDDIAVTAGYRGTLINLGLMGVFYHRLDEYTEKRGDPLTASLNITQDQLEHLCRCFLDEMRVRGAFSRPMLCYHTSNTSCPAYIRTAEWERRVKQPVGYPVSESGDPLPFLDRAELPYGISLQNAWRRPGTGGSGPSLERILKDFQRRFGGVEPDVDAAVSILDFLKAGGFLTHGDLYGARQGGKLLQVNEEIVRLQLVDEETRFLCQVCGTVYPGGKAGMPCRRCHGTLVRWFDSEIARSRAVQRIRKPEVVPLVAGEHTAQVPNDRRIDLEESFKAKPEDSKVNVLACSPTLEMGIDVGGLDAVVLRNIPPRPDNYAQRGGRAGRRSRVGLVLGYARSTPHDQYFYDEPVEMIAGEVPAPIISIGNRDVILRHLNAIAFSAADPGLAGKMVDYVGPTGEVKQEAVDTLIEGVKVQFNYALETAKEAFGEIVLTASGLNDEALRRQLDQLPERIQDVVNRTARQVIELRQALDRYATDLVGAGAGIRAGDLIARLLGIMTDRQRQSQEADDRSAGYPLRRFSEFGILPGYEFPTEPATLRLRGDPHEEDPVAVARRFGIAQYQPDAQVYARTKRWKVIGLDMASPWNPRTEGPSWYYRLCRKCDLRFRADHPRCPRCKNDDPGSSHQAAEFAGFLARRDETPVLDEEERYATRNLVRLYPQWDGDVTGRWTIGPGWSLRLSCREEIQWINEGRTPSDRDLESGLPILHPGAKGYLLCSSCGQMLSVPEENGARNRGRRQPRNTQTRDDLFGHSDNCPQRGAEPRPLAIATSSTAEVLRILLPVPSQMVDMQLESWGLSLGYALRTGIRQLYMLDGPEIEFVFEGPWKSLNGDSEYNLVSLTFVDPSIGGTGYLSRIAREFHFVAERTLEHLNHPGCETACYRCLKSYENQRYHEILQWPVTIPHLEVMKENSPAERPLETGDIDDPRPWLEAYAAGVGSPLELRFLRLFEKHGFHPDKQVPVSPNENTDPISVADFAVSPSRLAIYVDGAAFHVGANLRRDRYIRDQLTNGNPPWQVVVLRSQDLAEDKKLVERIQGLL